MGSTIEVGGGNVFDTVVVLSSSLFVVFLSLVLVLVLLLGVGVFGDVGVFGGGMLVLVLVLGVGCWVLGLSLIHI